MPSKPETIEIFDAKVLLKIENYIFKVLEPCH